MLLGIRANNANAPRQGRIELSGDAEELLGKLQSTASVLVATKLTALGTERLVWALVAGDRLPSGLREMSLMQCWELRQWPEGARLPAGLLRLTIVGSRLERVPDLTACVALEAVDLHDNHVGSIALEQCPWLPPGVATVDMSYNKIHAIDDWRAAFPENAVSIDVSFNFLKVAPPSDMATRVQYHHNELPNKEYARGMLFALDPATGVWASPRTGDVHTPVRVAPLFAPMHAGMHAGTLVRVHDVGVRVHDVGVKKTPTVYEQRQSVHDTGVQAGARAAVSHVLELARKSDAPAVTDRDLVLEVWPPGVGWWWWVSPMGWWRLLMGGGRRGGDGGAFDGLGCVSDRRKELFAAVEDVHGGSFCGLSFGELLSSVWAVIQGHEHAEELSRRLREELFEGRGMCFTGRATRLLNALQGFVDGVHVGVSKREAMQARITAILVRLQANAANAAPLRVELDEALADGGCDAAEREAWRDAFDERAPSPPPAAVHVRTPSASDIDVSGTGLGKCN
jgi:hypothetical protein